MREGLERILAALGRTTPPELAEALGELGSSVWPEVADRWSLLTPSGCPVELTVGDDAGILRWTTEVAGPEVAETERVGIVARRLEAAGQPVPPSLLSMLEQMQRGRDLKYGAWLGGRTGAGTSRLKLYVEIPRGMPRGQPSLPSWLVEAMARVPSTWALRMIGVEPVCSRTELYYRLPDLEPDALSGFFCATGHAYALEALERSLPDGLRRLAGRRLGASVAIREDGTLDAALFVSARSLFPGAPERLATIVPLAATLPIPPARLTLVTLRLDPRGQRVSFAVGVTVAVERSRAVRRV